MIRIITIEREYGCGGAAIARKLADRLGWKLWDQDLTGEIARLAKCDKALVERHEERVDPLFYRLVKVFLRGSFERSLPVGGLDVLDAESMLAFMQHVVGDAAAAGNCVIVGRGATYILRDHPDAFHAFIYAPYEEKIRRVRGIGKTEAQAIELVNTIDSERIAFVKRYYGKDWPSRELYHVMLNSKAGDEAVMGTILHEISLLDQVSVSAR